MVLLKGTIQKGQVVLPMPAELPDGTEVTVLTDESPNNRGLLESSAGPDDDVQITPEEIARTLAAMDKIEPFDLTADERADLDAWEQRVNEHTIANTDRGIEDVFR